MAALGKKDLVLVLKGVTTDGRDVSVDTLRTSGLPHLAMFLDKEGLELKVRNASLAASHFVSRASRYPLQVRRGN